MSKMLVDENTVNKYLNSYKEKNGTIVELQDQTICYGENLKTMVVKPNKRYKTDRQVFDVSLTDTMPKKVMKLLGIKEQPITITCYGKQEVWTSRAKAKKFYLDCMHNSEGSERERYTNIYIQLNDGLTECNDDLYL